MIRYIPFSDKVSEDAPSVICLGNFDGVHKGHAALISKALDIKSRSSLMGQKIRIGALCFETLTSDYFNKNGTHHLMTLEKKLETFQSMGLDCAYVCDFQKIKDLSPNAFIEDILLKKCSCVGAICGFDFKFGKNASGDAQLLVDHFKNVLGNDSLCCIVPPVTVGNKVVSSSSIREAITSGSIEEATVMLGRPFSITHTVVHGKHLGTKLGFPTINHVFNNSEIIPSFGIYATKTVINGECFVSVTNVGTRPTVSSSGLITCETHIIGESKSFYGQDAEVFFYTKLRDEKHFSSTEELSKAISADVEAATNYFTK